jgi:hypothetical protein
MAADLILDEANNINAEDDNPPTVRHAQRSKYWNKWLAAMHEELEALKAKGVYEEVDQIPPGRKPVQCKWVLRIKRDQNGQISRFKGRLVAKGFTQIFGQDFTFTFAVTSPVLSWCCAPTYASPLSPPSLSVPTGPLYRIYRTNFGRCRDLDA